MIGYLCLSKVAPWGPFVCIHCFDGALFIKEDRDAGICNLLVRCVELALLFQTSETDEIKLKEFLRLREDLKVTAEGGGGRWWKIGKDDERRAGGHRQGAEVLPG